MKIKNKQFGEIEFETNSVISFSDGILGFEEYKQFLLLSENEGSFFWLTSIDEPELVFPLFSIKLLEEECFNEEEVEPFGIVKLAKEPENVTINLKAPVFIDRSAKIGYQKIIDNEEFKVNYPLFVKN